MSIPARRLWDKGGDIDELLHRFTVGDDPLLDRAIAYFDCIGSAAHARGLARIGILSSSELRELLGGLSEVAQRARRGEFEVLPELEDCHTAIEAFLTQQCGDAGKKIHTGRSRNDQVATAMRLYLRCQTLERLDLLQAFAQACLTRLERDREIPLPGYTHLQPAMPSSVGQWLHAWIEAVIEQMRAGIDLLDRLDSSPLGTGAGFGVPLPLERAYTARLLGFTRVQRSPIDVQNSRGRIETYFVRWCVDIASLLEKLACDLMLFATAEFGLISLPERMTTGSSLMPQKRNPDVLELMRGRAARMRGILHELEWVTGKLPSSYHRDLQLTKAPAMTAAAEIALLLRVGERVVAGVEFDRARCTAAMRPELYATAAALQRVQNGEPFRTAYRAVADEVREGRFTPPASTDSSGVEFVSAETLRALRANLAECASAWGATLSRVEAAERAIFSPE